MLPSLVSFPPIIDSNCKVLILGSMPGVASLKAEQYYAHPRNQFWPIMTKLLKEAPESYSDRVDMLLCNGIALWDVAATCKRKGSLDSDIRDVVPNDIEKLLIQYPKIERIYCNGQTSYKLFCKHIKSVKCDVQVLPSTSPAYTISFKDKFNLWKMIDD